jgi:small-conductance mechanosensitive channel
VSDASTGTILLVCAAAAGVALVLGAVLTALIRRIAARHDLVVTRRPVWQAPLTVLLVLAGVRTVLAAAGEDPAWVDDVAYVVSLGLIAAVAWVLTVLVRTAERATLSRHPASGLTDRGSRHVRTKALLVSRVVQALIASVALGAMLWTIPGVREVGIGVLASASVVAVVVGLAAQTTLGNLFAGLQIAFTDAIRIDDIVVIEEQWGRIDEITLTYVAVRVWDGTSVILPCTYFTTTPFRNWTHQGAAVTGTVEIAADWTVPIDDLRAELSRLLERSPRWDRSTGELHVSDASGDGIKLIALVSAVDGDALEPLRWEVREGLVRHLQQRHRHALPRERHETVSGSAG